MRISRQECGVCKHESDQGMYLMSMWLCKDCERAIVELEIEDASYQWYVEQLRKSKMNLLLTH